MGSGANDRQLNKKNISFQKMMLDEDFGNFVYGTIKESLRVGGSFVFLVCAIF